MRNQACRDCIVGAGPAGLVVGHILHQAKIPFVVLERQKRQNYTRSRMLD